VSGFFVRRDSCHLNSALALGDLYTGYGKLILCEFDYTNQPRETFPIDQSKERWSMFMLKRWILPWLYWNQILPGKM
jgi:sulfide:quinone oxidoreductase